MNPTAAKGFLLTGGIGTAGLVTYGGYLVLQKGNSLNTTSPTIWQVVSSNKEKFVLSVDTSFHDEEWGGIVTTIANEPKIKGIFGSVTLTKEALKSWCSRNKTESSGDKDLLSSYESWCTKNSIFGQLKELKKEALKESDSQQWEVNFSSYKNTATQDNRITGENGQTKSDSTLENKEELTNWCLRNSSSLYKETSAVTKAYLRWCIKSDVDAAATTTIASRP